MTTSLPFVTMDVFTDRRFTGNPLAIVEAADGIETTTMQAVAREFNLSETIFLQKPDNETHTARVRIFVPFAEIPFAGHPTIGSALYLATRDAGPGDFKTRIVLESAAGAVSVIVTRRAGKAEAVFTAPVLPAFQPGELPEPAMAAAALGLEPGDIGFLQHSIARYHAGPSFLFIPIASRSALANAWPAGAEWSRMVDLTRLESVYLYTPNAEGEFDYHARMFSPGNGIPEDPATGSASAMLAAQLLAAGELSDGTNRFGIEQGMDMGRPSRIGVEADISGGQLTAVRVSGSAVSVSSGTIEIDGAG